MAMKVELGPLLFTAACEGRLDDAKGLVEKGADPNYKDPADLETPLMKAAEFGHVELARFLLDEGAPWNELDRGGHCAGEYASATKQLEAMDLLMEWGVMAETVLGERERAALAGKPKADDEYLKQGLSYSDDGTKLMDDEGEAVMMDWELPLMVRHAQAICTGGGDVLNVGFGLGLIDDEIQKLKPRSHTIIEAHPTVHKRMVDLGWGDKPGVRVVKGKWQDVLGQVGPFDGIFFDTYSEHYSDMQEFHAALPKLLRPGGVYSFFNGLCPDNIFFSAVYGRLVSRELSGLGMDTRFELVEMDASEGGIWKGVKNRYWHHDKYFLPTCTMRAGAGPEEGGAGGGDGGAAGAEGE